MTQSRSNGRPEKVNPVFVEPYPANTTEGLANFVNIFERKGRTIVDRAAFDADLKSALAEAVLRLCNDRTIEEKSEIRRVLPALLASLAAADDLFTSDKSEAQLFIRDKAIRCIHEEPSRTQEWAGVESIRGEEVLRRAKLALSDLRLWTERACNQIEWTGPRGKPINQVATQLASKLAVLWLEHTGEFPAVSNDPTHVKGEGTKKIGDFVDFCGAAITPIWKKYGKHEHPPEPGYYAEKAANELEKNTEC